MSAWVSAPRMPMSIVSPPTTMSSTVRSFSAKITVSVRMIA